MNETAIIAIDLDVDEAVFNAHLHEPEDVEDEHRASGRQGLQLKEVEVRTSHGTHKAHR